MTGVVPDHRSLLRKLRDYLNLRWLFWNVAYPWIAPFIIILLWRFKVDDSTGEGKLFMVIIVSFTLCFLRVRSVRPMPSKSRMQPRQRIAAIGYSVCFAIGVLLMLPIDAMTIIAFYAERPMPLELALVVAALAGSYIVFMSFADLIYDRWLSPLIEALEEATSH